MRSTRFVREIIFDVTFERLFGAYQKKKCTLKLISKITFRKISSKTAGMV